MKTIWTAPGRGSTLAELKAGGYAAFPHLCNLPTPDDENYITDLLIMDDGTWETYDISRIRNATIVAR